MKHIFLNLKRFDVPVSYGGVNRIAPMQEWGSFIVKNTQDALKKYDPREVEFVQFLPEAHLLNAVAARCADPAIADDLKYVLATANAMAAGRYQVAYCPSLVRGQGYYTGMVFEVTCPQFSGAVAGGGRYDNMVGKFLGVQVPAVGFSIGFERVCGILLEQGYQIPGAKQKIALLYGKDTDFPAVLHKAAALREQYNVTVLPQGKKLGKQLGQLEAAGFAGAAFMDKDEVKIFAQQ